MQTPPKHQSVMPLKQQLKLLKQFVSAIYNRVNSLKQQFQTSVFI